MEICLQARSQNDLYRDAPSGNQAEAKVAQYMRMCFVATKGKNLIITVEEPIE